MITRKEQKSEGTPIPVEWVEEFLKTLEDNFNDKKKSEEYTFDAFGKIYENELLLISCFYNTKDLNQIPISCHLSADLTEKVKKDPKKILTQLTDLMGLFYDDYFATEDFSDWEPEWQNIDLNSSKNKFDVFFRITRENIILTVQADKILKNDSSIN
jgi:hypothetical protein